jgi:hypothetical protein
MKTLLDLEMCERCYVCRDVKFVAEIVLVRLLGVSIKAAVSEMFCPGVSVWTATDNVKKQSKLKENFQRQW